MKQKTAMQELIEYIYFNWIDINKADIEIEASRLLEKEKQQIVEAHNAGMDEFSNDPSAEVYQGEQYFQLKFEKL